MTLANPNFPAIMLPLGLVAQLVEQRIENPCVGGSIPPRATKNIQAKTPTHAGWRFCFRRQKTSHPVHLRYNTNRPNRPTVHYHLSVIGWKCLTEREIRLL